MPKITIPFIDQNSDGKKTYGLGEEISREIVQERSWTHSRCQQFAYICKTCQTSMGQNKKDWNNTRYKTSWQTNKGDYYLTDKVLAVHDNKQTGVLRTTRILRADGFNISYQAVYEILGAAGRMRGQLQNQRNANGYDSNVNIPMQCGM